MPTIFSTTSIVFLIQNILTREFLTYDGTSAVMHNVKAHQDKFHLFGTGSDSFKYIQLFEDSSIKLSLESNGDFTGNYLNSESQNNTVCSCICSVNVSNDGSGDEPRCCSNAAIGMTENQWYIEHPRENTNNRVRLYILKTNGEKWYLRAHFHGRRVDLVHEDYVKCVDDKEESFFSQQELKFNLVASDVMELVNVSI